MEVSHIVDKFSGLTIILLIIFALVGVFCGRVFCGRICPYGFLQDLLHKIPFPKKIRSFKADKYLRYIKYALLLLLAVEYMFGSFDVGTDKANGLNTQIIIVIAVFVFLCIIMSRPFCKYLCPVGGLNGLFNLLPSNKYKVNQDTCNKCGACTRICKMDIDPYKTPNHVECIRCGKCKKKCPNKAITSGLIKSKL
jgi:polyferredoxin